MKLAKPRFPESMWARMVLAVVTPLAVTAAMLVVVPQAFGLPSDAAFRVGGTVVGKDQLAQRAKALRALYGIQQPEGGPDLDRFHRDVAKAVAVSMVLDRAAQRRQIVIPEKSARDTMTKMIDEQLGADGRRQFTDLLGSLGVSEAEVLDEIKRQQSIGLLFQQVTGDAVRAVTDDQLPAYYDANRAKFAVPEQRHLRNVVVATREQADDVHHQATTGTDLGALAARVSLDEGTRLAQGDLGTLAAVQLEAGYATAAFGAAPGAVFGPVQTRFGWNVGQVLGITPAQQLPFEQVRDQVREELRADRALAAWNDWLRAEIAGADVEYAEDYRPADPDAPPVQAAPLDERPR
ncbi:peptidylprolyl isomerase [Amycolatopsis thermoflava]|uniref:peptidylprolyl isomerase n=1 Tax=Amycolatopsis thermoflava TaxID=84480 RepID=UPI00381EFAF2